MAKYWLVKSDPDTWHWDDHVKARVTGWDGVRNAQASNYMKQMRVGDQAFFYHSQTERAIVGIVEVTKEAHPDPTDDTGRWVQVEFKAGTALPTPVTLAQIKGDELLKGIPLVRQSRLSVMPIDAAAWKRIRKLSGLK